MSLNPVKNFFEEIITSTILSGSTSFTVGSGIGANFIDPAVEGEYNLVVFNATDYPSADTDPYAVFFKTKAVTVDTITIEQPASGNDYNGEGDTNIARDLNIAGKTYKCQRNLSKDDYDRIQTELEGKELAITYPTENPETKYYRGDKTFHEIVIGSGGFAGNVYLSNETSTIEPTYKQLSYGLDAAEVVRTVVVNNETKLVETVLFEEELGVTLIPSGVWRAVFNMKSTEERDDTQLIITVFKRATGGTETDLFTMTSDPIQVKNEYTRMVIEYSPDAETTLATDILGARIYGKTLKDGDVTINYIVGDGRGAYFNTTLPIRHDQIREPNGDVSIQHITTDQKNKLDGIEENADVTDATNVASTIHGATGKTTPVDNDELALIDSAATYGLKKLTWTNLKSKVASYIASLTQTLTNKRITKRVATTTTGTTITPTGDSCDIYTVTALAANTTIAAPSGTPTNGQPLVIRIRDNGTARTMAWNAIYRVIGVELPTTTVVNKTVYIGGFYNTADSKWDITAVGQEEA